MNRIMKMSFVKKLFIRNCYNVQDGQIIVRDEAQETYLCTKNGNTNLICKEEYLCSIQAFKNFETDCFKYGRENDNLDYTNLLKRIDSECRQILECNYSIELNIYKILKHTYLVEQKVCEEYFLGRYEIYISTTGQDAQGDEFSMFEVLDGFTDEIEMMLIYLKKKIKKLQQTREERKNPHIVEDGKYVCILSNYFSALLVHECIGHLSELDIYNKYIEKRGAKNKYECIPEIVIKDIGAMDDNNEIVPCPLKYDDEGNICINVNIFCNQEFTNKLTDEVSSKEANIINTGNARLGYLESKKMIRMRNTYLQAGKDTFDKMIQSIDRGLFLIYPDIGCVLPSSYFEMKVLTGYWIEKGKIINPIETIYASSNTEQVISSISMISDTVEWFGTRCFKKGEEVYCGTGAPMLKLDLDIRHRSLIQKKQK